MNNEIWAIATPTWKLPIIVSDAGTPELVLVSMPPIPLLQVQLSALGAVLDGAGTRDGQLWQIPRIALLLIARPSKETDPEAVVEWSPGRKSAPIQDRSDDRRHAGHLELLALLVDGGVFGTIEQADKIVRLVFRAMLHRLAVDRAPVHLSFIQLWPVPLRANWKEITLAGDINRRRTLEDDDPFAPTWLSKTDIEKRVGHDLTDPKLLAMERNGKTIRWNIEVRYLGGWIRTVRLAETKRKELRSTKNDNYGTYLYAIIRKYRDQALLHYKQYLWQVALPHVDWDSDSGAQLHRYVAERAERLSAVLSAYEVRNSPASFSLPKSVSGVCDGPDLPGTTSKM